MHMPTWDLLGGSVVKNMPAKQETQVLSLGQKYPLEKEMETHSNILAWDRGAWWATVHGVTKSRTWFSETTSTYANIQGNN